MDAATERRVLGLIGLGLRARNAVVGVERVREDAKRGRLALVVIASDASPNSLDKLLPLLEARRVRVVPGPSADALGAIAGRPAVAAIGITDRSLARGLRKLVEPAGSPSDSAPVTGGSRPVPARRRRAASAGSP